jgi:sugar/nucleoside kinase (ribokinase family)
MNDCAPYDILCIGNYTKDTIISPAGTTYVDGGAVNYAAHATARLGLRTAVVTRLSREDQRVVTHLTSAGVDCYPTFSATSTIMRLEYPTSDPDVRTLSVTGTAGAITAQAVECVDARSAVIGSSLRGEVGLDVVKALHAKGVLVGVDVQGFVRVLRDTELRKEPWLEMAETLSYVDILKSDAVESEYLTGETDIRRAAQVYASLGPREIVLTHKDGLLIYADGAYHSLQFYPTQLNGRSGRGDTCIAAYVGMRLSKSPREAGNWAAALTSLKMEQPGPFNRTRVEVEELIHSKYNGSARR